MHAGVFRIIAGRINRGRAESEAQGLLWAVLNIINYKAIIFCVSTDAYAKAQLFCRYLLRKGDCIVVLDVQPVLK